MNIMISKLVRRVGLAVLGGVLTLTACNPEPDESDLYTFTGETIESFIQKDSSLTNFNYILGRVGYDRILASYGIYTCFAPTNEGVIAYCDSLYDDAEATIPHNGMTARSLEGLSDSLCLSIVRYHLVKDYKDAVKMVSDDGIDIRTMLGYNVSCTADSLGNIVLNNKATIFDSDNEVINGLVHKLNNVIPRYNRPTGEVLKRNPDYSIFAQALEVTGWADSLKVYEKDEEYTYNQIPRDGWSNVTLDYQDYCQVGFTVFAESDEEMKRNGINSFDDLVAYANRVYANAPEWYDYMSENGYTVSTGTDYTEWNNALNMFVAYHIVGAMMSPTQLVFEKSQSKFWNYAPDAAPYDYYETKLPHTMLKTWQPTSDQGGNGRNVYVNRYQTFNTLTNEVGTQGTNHSIIKNGFSVNRTAAATQNAFNAYILSISNQDAGGEYKGLLVYDRTVPKMVLNERMRVNCTSLFPELITNGIRYNDTYAGSRYGLPSNFFDNIQLYNAEICFCYCSRGSWRSWQADQLQFWGGFDFAFKLPPVPSGLYELRVIYAPMSYGAFVQYYIGNSRDISSMRAMGIPLDMTIDPTDPLIGWTAAESEEDRGIASDVALHNRGYMRSPYSMCGHGENGWSIATSARCEGGFGTSTVRVVLGREQLNQGDENWVRIKLLSLLHTVPMSIDFIELCPVSVADNQQYIEDWY